MSTKKTKSEGLFENFLCANRLPFDPIPVANSPRPDYQVNVGALTLIFEVKELSEDENFKREPFAVSSRIVGYHIRSKIKEARKQVKFGADQGIPSILLFYNDIDPMHLFGTENHEFIAAMYGEHAYGLIGHP